MGRYPIEKPRLLSHGDTPHQRAYFLGVVVEKKAYGVSTHRKAGWGCGFSMGGYPTEGVSKPRLFMGRHLVAGVSTNRKATPDSKSIRKLCFYPPRLIKMRRKMYLCRCHKPPSLPSCEGIHAKYANQPSFHTLKPSNL